MRFLKKVHDNIKTKRTNHATKIDVFFFILRLLFQYRPSRVRVKTVVKKKRLEVILRELSVRDVDLLANWYHISTLSHISPSPSIIDNNHSKRRHMHATKPSTFNKNNEKGT